jgi:HK97 family phage major capsid protein/HK97 family phage prohead protease
MADKKTDDSENPAGNNGDGDGPDSGDDANVVCSGCGQMNSASAEKCSSCGEDMSDSKASTDDEPDEDDALPLAVGDAGKQVIVPKRDSAPPRDNLVRAMSRLDYTRAEGDDKGMPTLVGHFAVFDAWTEIDSFWEGEFMERIQRGAFKKTFSENGKNIRCLFQHGQDFQIGDKVLGAISVLREDSDGAYYEVPLFDTSYNRDLVPGIEAGQYGASFRFRVMQEQFIQNPKPSAYNPRGIPERTIKECAVMEFGPVTFPAYPEATAGVRSSTLRSLTDDFILEATAQNPEKFKTLLARRQGLNKAKPGTAAEPKVAPEALSDAGAGVATHSNPDESRGQPASTAATAPNKPVISKESRHMSMAGKTIEERRQRDEEIGVRFQEIHSEFGATQLPDESKAEWDNLIVERNENRAAISDYERRSRELALMANNGSDHEPVGLNEHRSSGRGTKGVPSNVYAVEEYRQLSTNMEELRGNYRAGALQILERATFPHPDAKRSDVQSHVQWLLDNRDDAEGHLAQRMIITGSPTYQRAFGKTLKGSPLTAEEQRAMALGSDADGGFAVPFQLDPTVILTSNGVINPIRQIARVEQIVGKEWDGVTSSGITVSRVAENTQASDDSPTLLQPKVRAERVQGFIPFSVELGQDWAALQSEMAKLLADAKDVEEANSFITGNGTPPQAGGLIGSMDAGSLLETATTGTFAVGDIYALEEAVPPRFRSQANIIANRAIYNRIRQFDTYGGASLWVRLLDGLGNELIGYPAREASVMASTVVTGDKVMVMGDFKQFLIVDRLGMSIELIPHLFGANGRPTGQRGIYAVWRNNSCVLAPNAFRVLEIK